MVFLFFFFFVSPLFSVSFGKKRDGNVPLRKQRCNVYLFLQVPDTSCFPKGCMLSPRFAQKHRKYNNKKNQPRRNPGLRKHLILGETIGSGGCMGAASLLHLNIFFDGMGKQGKSTTLPVRMSTDYFIRNNFVKKWKNRWGWSEAIKKGFKVLQTKTVEIDTFNWERESLHPQIFELW